MSATRILYRSVQRLHPLSSCPLRVTPGARCYGEQKSHDIEQAAVKEYNDQANEQKKKKTMAQLDEELRAKLEGRSGGGGEAGLELEGGKPVAMKRGVKDNMFRLI